ncbi:hypothetical protein H0H81_007832 [Sphagnurus paluster]|uniref:D-lactate dehydrogenase (cytochrome) n=1 Tax=Sphagnurus paluster TaxID=117069 RepID=A0A9P7FUG6_9AGAR|nr:hypothetical protein H0H81_007832 [Sphagnurus paluster]
MPLKTLLQRPLVNAARSSWTRAQLLRFSSPRGMSTTPGATTPSSAPRRVLRYSPWSKDFSGSLKSRILLQSAFYAVCIVTAIELVDSYLPFSSVSQSKKNVAEKALHYASPHEIRLAIDELRSALPGVNAVVTDSNALKTYGFSENSYHPASPHSVVVSFYHLHPHPFTHLAQVRPTCTADVVNIVNISRKYRIPVTAYSGATSLEGHTSGTAVLPNGEVIKTRSRARKSAAGFDTTKLFIGAEGTLGIVTEVTLRLAPVIPTKVAMAQFPDVEHAVSAVQEILNTPYGPHILMNAINSAGLVDHPYPVEDTLFFKIQGDPASIKNTSKAVQEIVSKHGSSRFEFASTDEEADDLWQNRKYALMSTLAANPGTRCWTTDVCVPVSRLPQLVFETKKDLADSGIQSTIVGHVGDGNFHALILFRDDSELQAVSDAVHRLVHRAIGLDGTCTGEHGVGVGKKEYLTAELGEGTVELMKVIKRAIDPLNLMNPGKLYPDTERSNEKHH